MSIDADAALFADELDSAIDRRYELRARQLATKWDIEGVRADLEKSKLEIIKDLSRQIQGTQRWTIAAVGVIVTLLASLQKLL